MVAVGDVYFRVSGYKKVISCDKLPNFSIPLHVFSCPIEPNKWNRREQFILSVDVCYVYFFRCFAFRYCKSIGVVFSTRGI